MLLKSLRVFPLILMTIFFFTACEKKDSVQEADTSRGSVSVANEGQIVTFIELGSVECIPCKAMVPVLEQIEAELGDQVNVVFHDVWTDEGSPYAKEFNIKVIPTQIFLNSSGEEYFRHEGFFPAEELYKILETGGVNIQ